MVTLPYVCIAYEQNKHLFVICDFSMFRDSIVSDSMEKLPHIRREHFFVLDMNADVGFEKNRLKLWVEMMGLDSEVAITVANDLAMGICHIFDGKDVPMYQ